SSCDDISWVHFLRHLAATSPAATSAHLRSRSLCVLFIAMEDPPGSERRGLHANPPPRPITQAQLASALRPFGIRPRTIWQAEATRRGRTFKGYYRHQFEAAWRSYCGIAPEGEEAERPEESRPRLRLRRD